MLVRAFFFGFLVSMPVGPTTVMFCRMTLQKKIANAWCVALGVAVADIILAYLAGFGSRLVTLFVRRLEAVVGDLDLLFLLLYVVLGVILCFGGLVVWQKPLTHNSDIELPRGKDFQDFVSAFLVTLLNPAAFIAFSTLLPFFGLHHLPNWGLVLLLIGMGSLAWWGFLMWLMGKALKPQSKIFEHIHQVMAIILCILGVVSFMRGIWLFFT